MRAAARLRGGDPSLTVQGSNEDQDVTFLGGSVIGVEEVRLTCRACVTLHLMHIISPGAELVSATRSPLLSYVLGVKAQTIRQLPSHPRVGIVKDSGVSFVHTFLPGSRTDLIVSLEKFAIDEGCVQARGFPCRKLIWQLYWGNTLDVFSHKCAV